MKFRFLGYALLAFLLFWLTSCGSNNSVASGAGVLYVTAQGDSSVSVFSINLGSGGLSQVGSSVGTGSVPAAIAVTPSITALFVANSASNTISSYAINSDGSLAAASGSTPTGTTPTAMAIDPGGKFLFVANQVSSDISVFSISGSSLTSVGPRVTTIPAGLSYPNGTLPSGLAVSASGRFLYVANELANFVSAFSVSASGALTPLGVPFYNVGLGPAGLAVTPKGDFLYVANSGTPSNNISAFSICDTVVTTCADVNSPDGKLTEIKGSPFPAGLGPVAIAVDRFFNFVYVVDKGSNTVSQYSFGGNGVLAPLSPGAISTGSTPVSIGIISGATGTDLGNTTTNPTDYVYVANNGSSTVSTYALNTTSGLLSVIGSPLVITGGQTSAVVAK